jgi:hypothetical protein
LDRFDRSFANPNEWCELATIREDVVGLAIPHPSTISLLTTGPSGADTDFTLTTTRTICPGRTGIPSLHTSSRPAGVGQIFPPSNALRSTPTPNDDQLKIIDAT